MLPPKTFYARRPGHPLLLLCLGVALTTLARAAVKEGDAFPKLEPADLKVLVGSTLPDTEGKVVLVDFWASWCAPCKASFPMLAKLNRELGPKGFVVVAVGIDEKPAAADASKAGKGG